MAIRGKQPTPTDLAYIAGFVDGEGSIGMYIKNPIKESHHTYYREQVTITQVDRGVLEYIQNFFPGSLTRKKTYSAKHRPAHQLKWTTVNAVDFVRAILPYLRVKREQAETIIQFRKSMKHVDRHQKGFGGKWITDEEEGRRKRFYDRIKSLNRTGVQPQRLTRMTRESVK